MAKFSSPAVDRRAIAKLRQGFSFPDIKRPHKERLYVFFYQSTESWAFFTLLNRFEELKVEGFKVEG